MFRELKLITLCFRITCYVVPWSNGLHISFGNVIMLKKLGNLLAKFSIHYFMYFTCSRQASSPNVVEAQYFCCKGTKMVPQSSKSMILARRYYSMGDLDWEEWCGVNKRAIIFKKFKFHLERLSRLWKCWLGKMSW